MPGTGWLRGPPSHDCSLCPCGIHSYAKGPRVGQEEVAERSIRVWGPSNMKYTIFSLDGPKISNQIIPSLFLFSAGFLFFFVLYKMKMSSDAY